MRVQEEIRPGEAASLSRLFRLIGAGERKICLELRDDIEDAPDPSNLNYRSIAVDVSPDERIDDRCQGLFLSDDAGVGAFRTKAHCNHGPQAWTIIAKIGARGLVVECPTALDEAPRLIATRILDIALCDGAVVNDQSGKCRAAMVAHDTLECPQPRYRPGGLGMYRIEAGLFDRASVTQQIRDGSVCLNSLGGLISGSSAGFTPLREAAG